MTTQEPQWTVRVLAFVYSDDDTGDMVMNMSRAVREVGGDSGAWGGNADPPDTRRTIGALWHVDAPSVGRAMELAVERTQAACAKAGLPLDELDEVTASPWWWPPAS